MAEIIPQNEEAEKLSIPFAFQDTAMVWNPDFLTGFALAEELLAWDKTGEALPALWETKGEFAGGERQDSWFLPDLPETAQMSGGNMPLSDSGVLTAVSAAALQPPYPVEEGAEAVLLAVGAEGLDDTAQKNETAFAGEVPEPLNLQNQMPESDVPAAPVPGLSGENGVPHPAAKPEIPDRGTERDFLDRQPEELSDRLAEPAAEPLILEHLWMPETADLSDLYSLDKSGSPEEFPVMPDEESGQVLLAEAFVAERFGGRQTERETMVLLAESENADGTAPSVFLSEEPPEIVFFPAEPVNPDAPMQTEGQSAAPPLLWVLSAVKGIDRTRKPTGSRRVDPAEIQAEDAPAVWYPAGQSLSDIPVNPVSAGEIRDGAAGFDADAYMEDLIGQMAAALSGSAKGLHL